MFGSLVVWIIFLGGMWLGVEAKWAEFFFCGLDDVSKGFSPISGILGMKTKTYLKGFPKAFRTSGMPFWIGGMNALGFRSRGFAWATFAVLLGVFFLGFSIFSWGFPRLLHLTPAAFFRSKGYNAWISRSGPPKQSLTPSR